MSIASQAKKPVKFRGGVHPRDAKELSNKCKVQNAPLLDIYAVILQQHIGAPPQLLIEKGDEVKKGQKIAEAAGFVSASLHSPTSGTIKDITEIPGPIGVKTQAVIIEADGKDEWGELLPKLDWHQATPEEIKERIKQCGLVGMGGAAFPTHVKLSPPAEKKIDYLILNGAECEPYLTADHRLMLENARKVVEGAAIMGKALGVENICIGVESNKADAIAELEKYADEFNVKVIPLRVRYPQGAEKQLIYAVTERKVKLGTLPMDSGCVVQNVGTAAAVTDAVNEGIPLIERITSVTGEPVVNPGNWRFKLGTPLAKAIGLAGGIKADVGKIILGGPMMGFAQKSLEVTVTKNTSGILLLGRDQVSQFTSDPCIRCGKCLEACAMNLQPGPVSVAVESENFDLAEAGNVMDCMECGACAYVCPSRRPLVQHMRRAKAEIRKRNSKKKGGK